MLTRRIIVCLDVDAGRVVKGVQFTKLRDAGDPAELAAAHAGAGADEIVLLDITATHEKRATLLETVRRTARELMVPFTVGGGIRSVDDASAVFDAGADKVAVNSAALADPTLITQIAAKFGSQAAVVAIDARRSKRTSGSDGTHFEVKKTGGRDATGRDAVAWAREAQEAGAGEFLVTSMDRDGTKDGFDMELTRAIEHFVEVFQPGAADAALAASIFHFGLIRMSDLKHHLQQSGVSVRWPC
jgi:cyclase